MNDQIGEWDKMLISRPESYILVVKGSNHCITSIFAIQKSEKAG